MKVMAPLEAHRLWAPVYDASDNPMLFLESRTLAPLLPDVRGMRVIDMAAGTGRWARTLKSLGASVVSVDLCAEMLSRAPRPAIIADACQMPFPDGYADLSICAFAFDYMPPCLDELKRVTRRGGYVFVSDMHPAAAAHGWTRSFRSSDEVIAIRARGGSLQELQHPELGLLDLIEAPLGEEERNFFDRTGKGALFEAACRVPAIFVAKWIRL